MRSDRTRPEKSSKIRNNEMRQDKTNKKHKRIFFNKNIRQTEGTRTNQKRRNETFKKRNSRDDIRRWGNNLKRRDKKRDQLRRQNKNLFKEQKRRNETKWDEIGQEEKKFNKMRREQKREEKRRVEMRQNKTRREKTGGDQMRGDEARPEENRKEGIDKKKNRWGKTNKK